MQLDPIPVEILCDEIILKSYVDNRGKIEYKDPETIGNVRVQLDHKSAISDNKFERMDNLIFVDVVNSKYSDIADFTISSVIFFDDVEYKISKVEKIKAYDRLHHLEVTVV